MFFVGVDGRGKMDLPEDGNGRWEMFGRFGFFFSVLFVESDYRDYYDGGLMTFFFWCRSMNVFLCFFPFGMTRVDDV